MTQPTERELSTSEAAEWLGVSHSFLVTNLLETDKIPFQAVGTHRRIALSDLLAYQTEQERRLVALEELAALDQELALY